MKLDTGQKYTLSKLFERQEVGKKIEEHCLIQEIIMKILSEKVSLQKEAFESLCKFQPDGGSQVKNADTKYLLGFCYLFGIGTVVDFKQAKDLFLEISNHDFAQAALGNLFCYGLGVEQSFLTAQKYFDEAKKQKNAEAFFVLGWMQLKGQGVRRDKKQAIASFLAAAELGYPDANYTLGRFYAEGRFGLEKDLKKSIEYYCLAAQTDHIQAHLALAHLYETGQGVAQDRKSAFEHWKAAADLGNSDAQCNLAMHYISLDLNNYKLAFAEFEKAALQNHSTAVFNIAWMLSKGWGTEKNLKRAALLFQKALLYYDNSKVNQAVLELYRENRALYPKIDEEVWKERIQEIPSTLSLNLAGARIEPEEIGGVLKAVQENPTLEVLDLSGNSFQNEGAEKIVQLLLPTDITKNSKIKTLRLAGCEIGDKAAPALAKMLASNSTLQSLDLSGNKFTSVGIAMIVEGIRKNTKSNLQALWLMDNDIHRDTFDTMVKSLDKNKTLRVVSVGRGKIKPLLFGSSIHQPPSYQTWREGVVMPYFNFWRQTYLENVINKFHAQLIKNDRMAQQACDEAFIKFNNYSLENLKNKSEKELEYLRELYVSAFKALELSWQPSPEVREQQYKEICRKIVRCSHVLPDAVALEWLRTLPRIESVWMAEAQFRIAELYEVQTNNSDHLQNALVYFEMAAKNSLFKKDAQKSINRIRDSVKAKKEQAVMNELQDKKKAADTQERLIEVMEERNLLTKRELALQEEVVEQNKRKIKLEEEQLKTGQETNKLAQERNQVSQKSIDLREKSIEVDKDRNQVIKDQTQAIKDQTAVMKERLELYKKNQDELQKRTDDLKKEQDKKIAKLKKEWKEHKESLQTDFKEFKEQVELGLKDYEQRLEKYERKIAKNHSEIQEEINNLKKVIDNLHEDLKRNNLNKKELEALQVKQKLLLEHYYRIEQDAKREKEWTLRHEAALELFQKQPSVYRFYRTLRLRLHAFFHGYQTLASGQVKREENTTKDKVANAVKSVVGEIPIPGAAQLGEVLSSKITASADQDIKNLAEKVTELALDHAKDNYVEETAKGLTLRYIEQLGCITEKSADRQAVNALKFIEAYINDLSDDKLVSMGKDHALIDCLMDSVMMQHLKVSRDIFGKERLKKNQEGIAREKMTGQKGPWNYLGMYRKPGIKVTRKDGIVEYYTFKGCRGKKYGCRQLTERQLAAAMKRDPSIVKIDKLQGSNGRLKSGLLSEVEVSVPPLLWSPRHSILSEFPVSPKRPAKMEKSMVEIELCDSPKLALPQPK